MLVRLSRVAEVDRCAEVNVQAGPELIEIVIHLADGRMAVREVRTPTEAVAVVEALLTQLPEAGRSESRNELRAALPSEREPSRGPASAPAPRIVVIDVGIGASLRVAGHPWFLGYGLSAQVSVAINEWLLGSWLRWDIQDRLLEGAVPRAFIASSFLLGAFTGRRFSVGNATLDLIAGPNLVIDTEEAAGPDVEDIGGELGSLSLGAALRLYAPRLGKPSFFAMLGADVSPSRLHRRVRADPALPALPAWGGTLVLGAAWCGL